MNHLQRVPFPLRLLLLLLLLSNSVPAAEPGDERAPRRAEPKADEVVTFSLLDYKGKHFELRRAEARVVVLFFTSFGCPTARQSVSKLRSLRGQFATNGVVFWVVNSATQEDPDDRLIERLVRSRGQGLVPEPALNNPEALRLEMLKSISGSTPVLRDEQQIVARRLGVKHTGEAIAIDLATSSIIYRGAVDDRPPDSGELDLAFRHRRPGGSDRCAGEEFG